MLDFEFGFEMKQDKVWGINGWILWGYWLVTYMKSMLDYYEIEIEKWKEIKRRTEEHTNIGVFESWEALNNQEL